MHEVKTLAEFKEVLAKHKTVLVDFTATWCGPCKMMAPHFEKFSKKYTDVYFCKVDVDANEETAKEYDVAAMPTFKKFQDGKKVDELVGANVGKLEALCK